MRYWLSAAVLAVAATAFWLGQTVTRSEESNPNLSGVWNDPHRSESAYLEEPPMQPWAEEIYKSRTAGVAAREKTAIDALDPTIQHCAPNGFPRILQGFYPFEIFQIPGRVLIYYEKDRFVRQIWTDGREHPNDLDPTWMGHSIGTWDGDTLIVDTIGLREESWLDSGFPHSDALHVVERYRRVDHDTLEVDLTFEDPKAYTKPWKGKQTFQLRPDWQISEHVVCEDRILFPDSPEENSEGIFRKIQ